MTPLLILIPTYNEKNNIAVLVESITRILPQADLLFLDDHSPDGTGAEIERHAARFPQVRVLHRPGKAGLGRAYLAGFRWALERNYAAILCMDADLSHAPEDLPSLVAALADADLVSGSRYLPGGRILNWPPSRRILSRAAALYTRLLSGMPFRDPTGGFNAYRRGLLESLDLASIDSNGYSFQIEMKHRAWMEGFVCREIPITFTERRQGKSKMSPGIVREALWVVWKLVLSRSLRRRPLRMRHPRSILAGSAT